MGVHGLTTYLREQKHSLARTIHLSNLPSEKVTLVVDAWSFIYEVVYCADLPWVYGGEYNRFAAAVDRVVRAWISRGLDLHFVFDGPYPTLKFPTLVSRITQNNIQAGLLFFRTSPTARAHPRFLRETAMLPPLMYNVCVDTLLRLVDEFTSTSHAQHSDEEVSSDDEAQTGTTNKQPPLWHDGPLHVHIADAEGDPYAVALAGRLGAYVGGRDSDFVVLNAEGYKGYVPLDEMVWTAVAVPPVASGPISRTTSAAGWNGDGSVYSASAYSVSEFGDEGADDDGFQVVKKGKGKKKRVGGHSSGAAASATTEVVVGKGILPPDESSARPEIPEHYPLSKQDLTLSFPVYAPSTLATHLGVPVSLLPLLGAFLGNDYTKSSSGGEDAAPPPATTAEIRSRGRENNLQRLFFDRGLTHAQRITRVAGVLSGILAEAFGTGAGGTPVAGAKKRGKRRVGSVMELIDAAVTALLVRPADTFATGEREAVVERIAEATLQYAIPRVDDEESDDLSSGDQLNERGGLQWVSNVCPLHTAESCPLVVNLSGHVRAREEKGLLLEEGAEELAVRSLYVNAYRRGRLDPHILDAVHTGTTWPRPFLEDPDKEAVQRSIGRGVRKWVYALLEHGVGLPARPEEPDEEDEDGEEDEDEDELVDVVEDDSDDDDSVGEDALARLRGALKELDGEDEDVGKAAPITANRGATQTKSTPSLLDEWPRRKLLTEYVRRGTRLAPEEVEVQWVDELLTNADPTLSRRRFDTPLQTSTWLERKAFILDCLETNFPQVRELPDEDLLGVLAVKYVVRQMHNRATESGGTKERLLERWTQFEARAVLACFQERESEPPANTEPVQIAERHVQLVAQVLVALDALEQLTQVMLVADMIPSPARRFSGERCHALLSGRERLGSSQPQEVLLHACLEGMEEMFAVPVQRKKDKKARGQAAAAAAVGKVVGKSSKGTAGVGGGMFGLLGEIDMM